jgi:heat shock protein HtpX
MWELIRSNQRKSIILFIFMGLILLGTGTILGQAYLPQDGGLMGFSIAFFVWVIWSVVGYFKGDSLILGLSRAKEVTHTVHPQLFNVVKEMQIAASLPATPRIYIIDDPAPNAFATGRKPENSAIAVTTGLLNRLNRTELQGVVAHEMSHILNRDILFLTFAGIMLGSIVLISEVFLRSLWFSGGSSRRFRSQRSNRSGGNAIAILAIFLAILAPILSRIFYFTLSRKREYLADASAARLSRYPEGLASALEKISSGNVKLSRANSVTAPMYIINPLKRQKRSLTGLFSTHPPVEERIKILRGMSGGVNYVNYQSAFQLVTGKGIIPKSGLRDSEARSIQKPVDSAEPQVSPKGKKRELGDLTRVINGYVFLSCVCGLKIKLPPEFKNTQVTCPRCERNIPVPMAKLGAISGLAAAGSMVGKGKKKTLEPEPSGETKPQSREMVYARKTRGWETMNCICGNQIQLSPALLGTNLRCNSCGRLIKIINH